MTEERSIASAKDKVQRAVGEDGLVGLVNNAGVGDGGPVETHRPATTCATSLEVNLVGQVAVTQAFLPLIREVQGTIVFIASIGGRIASPFMSPYNTSKFAVEALGESLRQELAPWDIDVVVVEPGSIDTPIWSKGAETIDEQTDNVRRREAPLRQAARAHGEGPHRDGQPRHLAGEGRGRDPQGDRSDNPKHRYLVGTDAKIAARLKGTLPTGPSRADRSADQDADRRASEVAAPLGPTRRFRRSVPVRACENRPRASLRLVRAVD